MSALPLDLVDTDGFNPREILLRAAPLDRHLDRAVDLVPAGPEHFGHLLPAQSLGPAGQKPGIAVTQLMLALAPGNHLDPDTAVSTGDPAHRIDQKHPDPPERHKLEVPRRQPVVTRTRPPAARAARPRVRTGPHLDFDRQAAAINQPRRAIDKRAMPLNPIQDSLELHPVPPRVDACLATSSSQRPGRDAPPSRAVAIAKILGSHSARTPS